jgi:PAS domain S-box-containing protein
MSKCVADSMAQITVDLSNRRLIRVLHVDDETSFLRITKQCLEAEGPFLVDEAQSVDEAMEKMTKTPYDAIVSDYQMPGKDGIEFLKELRQEGNKMPFIILTGKGSEEVAVKAFNLGADQYLNKTADSEALYCELARTICSTIERKKAEEALRENEDMFRNIVENSQDVILLTRPDGIISYVNPASSEELGYEPQELVGKQLGIIHPDDLEKVKTAHNEASKGGKGSSIEYRVLTKAGNTLWVSHSWSPIIIHGKVKSIVSAVRDITEHKRIEEALKESEEKYKDLFESAADVIITLDLNGNITSVNNAVSRFGYKKEDVIGKNILDFISKEYWSTAMSDLSRVIQGKTAKNETEVKTQVGKLLVEYSARAIIRENSIAEVQINLRDITERKKAEAQARESQQKFAGLFKGNPEATVHTDQDMHILDINPRFTSLFGYSIDEVKGARLNDVLVPKHLMEEAQILDRKAFEGYVYYDTTRAKKDGTLIDVSISAAPIFIEGQLTGYIGVYKDISQLKKTENELKQAMRRQEITNEKLRVIGSLTRHDVQNKMSTIVGNTFLAKKRIAGDDKVLGYLKEIEMAVQQSVRIFDFAKVYEMLGAEELSYLDVEKTINEAVSLYSDLGDTKVVNNCHGLIVLADSLLRQLFYNLIDNSLKHGKKTTMVRIHYERIDQNKLELIYEDDGMGIAATDKQKLFKEGYTTGSGSGYGLFLIKKMVEVYGWTIQETGEPSKGARFTITIPEKNSHGKKCYRIA